ncbi:MAG: hypothetical protein KJO55_00370, partial [Gammaproteobacteria bacterium]|nr:hypothetical protein [Gammaproteobacteria bacterium]
GSGRCLEDMAAYLFNTDVDSATADVQNVITYTIGFGPDVEAERLERTALRGGGKSFTIQDFDPAELEAVFNAILAEVREKNTAFAAPAVAVNSFNRTQNLDDLYFGVFKAQGQPHWDGNLKKYRFVNGEIVGVDTTTSAVDPATGFFKSGAQSYWSTQVDGFEAAVGGAASLLSGPVTRTMITSKAGAQLASATNNFDANNITNADLAISPPDDALRTSIIDWTRGQDVLDEDGDGDTAEARMIMGYPLHSAPAVVIYGGSPGVPDPKDAVVYFGTNDGLLHGIDGKTGSELFAFLPKELLRNLKNFYTSAQQAQAGSGQSINKAYGIDGSIQVLRKDVNGDGIINAGGGDQVVLYFGMRRGEDVDGSSYYFAVDVSNRNDPRLLWTLGPGQLPNLGQTWSTPMLTRVNVSGASQNADGDVLIFGGGYSTSQDSPGYSTDSVGNAIFMVDAQSGNLLWSAGNAAPHKLVLGAMNNSIPANVRVLDLNNDQFADRMYVGDMGGRLWRFDIFNGQPANQLVTGGVIASLGAADLTSPTVADNRRFYNAPDVSFVPAKTGNYLNIAIGSGYRAHPLNQSTNDRFYGIRDYNPFNQLDQTAYDAITASPVLDSDPNLVDVTSDPSPTMPAGTLGWKLSLPGEKVLAESRTVDGTVIFTSFSPVASTIPCEPGQGLNKLYQVSVFDASPVTNLDGVGSETALSISDRSKALAQTGIAPTPTFIFPSPQPQSTGGEEGCEGEECACEGDDCGFPTPKCLVGLESCDVDFGNPPVRTFWTQLGIDPP